MKARRTKKRPPQIPLSAMSDIAMLLLIFFIVTTSFLVQRRMEVELPSITPEEVDQKDTLITVYVKDEAVMLDLGGGEERIEMEELAPYLAAKLVDRTRMEDRAVILDGDAAVPYERIARAANEIKRGGGIITMMQLEQSQ